MIDVGDAEFEELVADALDALPPELTRAMDNVVVLIEDANEEDPTILGLYHGVSLTQRDSNYGFALPDAIFIYRTPLRAMCTSRDHLRDEVLITVVHEIAHHFGIDDAALHRMGWG